jgi:hypothetical protein
MQGTKAHGIAYLHSSTAASKTTAPGPAMFHGLDAWHTAMRKMNAFLSLNHRTRCVRSIPKCAIAEVVCWEMYSRIHYHLLRLMKNEPGIRLFRHRLSRLEIMPSHHAVNILQQKDASLLLLYRAGDGVPRLRGTCSFEMEVRNDRSLFAPAHSTGVSGCLLWVEIVQ